MQDHKQEAEKLKQEMLSEESNQNHGNHDHGGEKGGNCPIDCKMALTPADKCQCSCNGERHGSLVQGNRTLNNFLDMFGYFTLTEEKADELGGKVKKVFNDLNELQVHCVAPKPGCEHSNTVVDDDNERFTIGQDAPLIACEHTGGVKDKDGQGHWIVVICPSCEYQAAWHKIYNKEGLKSWK